MSQGTLEESLELRPAHQLMELGLWESERKLVLQVSLVLREDLQTLLPIIILGNNSINLALTSMFREQMVCSIFVYLIP